MDRVCERPGASNKSCLPQNKGPLWPVVVHCFTLSGGGHLEGGTPLYIVFIRQRSIPYSVHILWVEFSEFPFMFSFSLTVYWAVFT